MAALRSFLMYSSLLTSAVIFVGWLMFNRTFDILLFGLIITFIVNAFYLYFSRPTVKTSDILQHASSGLTLVSLELRYLSEEAQFRETEAEKIRLANAEKEKYKLQVAKDMLNHLQLGLPPRRGANAELKQITHRPRIGNEVLAQLVANSKATRAETSKGADLPMPNIGQPAVPAGLPKAKATLN